MNKKYLFVLLTVYNFAGAQVPNGSFEEFQGYGNETRFWGANPMFIAVTIDNGGTIDAGDTIIYEPDIYSSCFFNNDARTGNRAMEIRNAFNVTKNSVVPGKMILFNEESGSMTATGWNSGYAVSSSTVIEGLGFYYKFFPLNDDIAEAKLEIFNANQESIGTAVVEISGLHEEYTYVSVPIESVPNDTPVFMTVAFSMTNGVSGPAFGSKLIIDDVTTTNLVLSNPSFKVTAYLISPTLATNEINIINGGDVKDGRCAVEIFTAQGKAIKKQLLDLYPGIPSQIDVSALPAGFYFIKANGFVTKFIKR